MSHIPPNTTSSARHWASLAAITLALSACGGGSDSASNAVTAPIPDITKAKASTSIHTGTLAAKHAQTASDADGNVLAVWSQSNGTHSEIWFDRFTAAGGWSGSSLLTSGNGDAQNPQITVDAKGDAWVVWQLIDGSTNNIWANRFTVASNTWGTATRIENHNGGDANAGVVNAGNASMPQIAADGSGNVLVVWQHADGQRSSIWANRFEVATQSWGTGVPIEGDDAGSAFDPQVLMDFNGNAVAAWSRWDSARGNIWTSRYLMGKGWATPVQLEAVTQSAHKPQISMDASGDTWVSWQEQSSASADSEGLATRYSFGTDWEANTNAAPVGEVIALGMPLKR